MTRRVLRSVPVFLSILLLCGGSAADDAVDALPRAMARRAADQKKPKHTRHVVVLMLENRSFDHFLGWLPGADGRQAGLTYTDRAGVAHSTHPLAPDYQGCLYSDPDHSYAGSRVEYDNGLNDGWLRAGNNDVYAIGYYTQPDLAFLGQAVSEWTIRPSCRPRFPIASTSTQARPIASRTPSR